MAQMPYIKTPENCISGNNLNTIVDCLSFRKQLVVLSGQISQQISIELRVSQGFILGAQLFLIYSNDLSHDMSINAELFADDTLFFVLSTRH